MSEIQPDLEWYKQLSSDLDLPQYCPYATESRCPKYFFSIALLGMEGKMTKMDKIREDELDDYWKARGLWPETAEEQPDVCLLGGGHYYKFCPEVLHRLFGWFASGVSLFPSDSDQTLGRSDKKLQEIDLKKEGIPSTDWRWSFRTVEPLHYSECREYSLLQHTTVEPLQPSPIEEKKLATTSTKSYAKFPNTEGLKWDDVTITVHTNGIKVKATDCTKKYSYHSLGLEGLADRPSIAWEFFRKLAAKSGALDASRLDHKTEREKIKQRLSKIRKALQKLMSIDGDPIPYIKKFGWKVAFKVFHSDDPM